MRIGQDLIRNINDIAIDNTSTPNLQKGATFTGRVVSVDGNKIEIQMQGGAKIEAFTKLNIDLPIDTPITFEVLENSGDMLVLKPAMTQDMVPVSKQEIITGFLTGIGLNPSADNIKFINDKNFIFTNAMLNAFTAAGLDGEALKNAAIGIDELVQYISEFNKDDGVNFINKLTALINEGTGNNVTDAVKDMQSSAQNLSDINSEGAETPIFQKGSTFTGKVISIKDNMAEILLQGGSKIKAFAELPADLKTDAALTFEVVSDNEKAPVLKIVLKQDMQPVPAQEGDTALPGDTASKSNSGDSRSVDEHINSFNDAAQNVPDKSGLNEKSAKNPVSNSEQLTQPKVGTNQEDGADSAAKPNTLINEAEKNSSGSNLKNVQNTIEGLKDAALKSTAEDTKLTKGQVSILNEAEENVSDTGESLGKLLKNQTTGVGQLAQQKHGINQQEGMKLFNELSDLAAEGRKDGIGTKMFFNAASNLLKSLLVESGPQYPVLFIPVPLYFNDKLYNGEIFMESRQESQDKKAVYAYIFADTPSGRVEAAIKTSDGYMNLNIYCSKDLIPFFNKHYSEMKSIISDNGFNIKSIEVQELKRKRDYMDVVQKHVKPYTSLDVRA